MSIIRRLSQFQIHYQTLYKNLLISFSTLSSSALEKQPDASIRQFISVKEYKKVLQIFQQQPHHPYSDYSINMILKACTLLKDYQLGVQIEKQFPAKIQQNHFIQTSLVQFYMQFNDMKNAKRIYSMINNKSNHLYAILFKGFITNGMSEKVLDFTEEMKIIPDDYTLTMIFSACAKVKNAQAKEIGIKFFNNMSDHSHTNVVLSTAALDMFMSFGNIDRAEKLFRHMKSKNAFSYKAMLKGYIENNMNEKVLNLFEKMAIEPDDVIYIFVFKACARLNNKRAQKLGQQLLDHVLKHSQMTVNLWNTSIYMLACFGDINRAEQLFNSLKHKKDIVAYGAMMKGYAHHEMNDKILDLFEQIPMKSNDMIYILVMKACAQLNNERAQKIGRQLLEQILNSPEKSDTVLNTAIQMLMSFGNVDRAEQVFSLLKNRDIISYRALMKGYVENYMSDRAIELFQRMPIKPDEKTFAIIFKACAKMDNKQAKNIGMQLVNKIMSKRLTDHIVLTSAISMLMSFGAINRAEQLFQLVQPKDLITYAVMMNGYAINDQLLKCKQCFEQMKQENRFSKSDIYAAFLQVCAQVALPSFYESIVDEIPSDLYNNVEIANQLIHLWGKMGDVEKAKKIFESIQNPNIFSYNNMLSSYALNGRGLDAVNLYQQIPNDFLDEISHVTVLNASSHSGLLHQARAIFNNIENKTRRIYTTMVDCLSRLHMFDEAEQLINEYEQQSKKPYLYMYMALLSGARNARKSDLSLKLYRKMEELFPNEKAHMISASALLENIHTSIGDFEQATVIRQRRKEIYGVKRKPGATTTEVDGEIVTFTAHDHSHPLSNEIFAQAEILANELREHGHQFDASWITRPLKDDETIESVLCGHSERIALAYNFIRGRKPSKIYMVKNLRVCGDCHNATKLIAKIHQCEIIVRDANRIHHFYPNGQCSCLDHF